MCPSCGSVDSSWSEVRPTGKVWSFCVVHAPVPHAFADRVPFHVAVVELDEHPTLRMVGDLVDVPSGHTVPIGAPVEAVFDRVSDGMSLVRWRLV